MADKKLPDENLYELLGISIEATTQQIKKAYRKTALTCHPDKNPDNPKAAELFHKLSKALEILTDTSARAAYDKLLRGKEAAKLRTQQLDSRRKKFKEELEAREKAAQEAAAMKSNIFDSRTDEEKLQAEIDRLRKEGSKAVEEEIRYVQKLIEEEREQQANRAELEESNQYRLRIRWNVSKNDRNNGGYSYEILQKLLSKYGNVVALILSPKKKGRALVEFDSQDAAVLVQKFEKGLSSNPFTVEWLVQPGNGDNVMKTSQSPYATTYGEGGGGLFPSVHIPGTSLTAGSSNSKPSTSPEAHMKVTGSDFESLVLHKMKQAEERKKLIENMEKEDDPKVDV